MSRPLTNLDRTRYRLQHRALFALLGPPMLLFHRLLGPSLPRATEEQIACLRERLGALFERDLYNVEQGVYPRDLLFRSPAVEDLRAVPALVGDLPRVAWRIWRRAWNDLPQDVDLKSFPPYYRRTFHWQSDGWLSDRSASLYDLEVEALFGGTGDVMRRMALPPLVEVLERHEQPRLLDIGCGTGRFLRHVLDVLPRARVSGLDLSPYYLARAHTLLGSHRQVSLVSDNAEHMPFNAEHFDAASCIFLFHELPPEVRRRVAAEAHRVIAPGGRLVVCDAAQVTDSPELQPFLEGFPRLYHEPFFKSYLRDDLGELLEQVGFEVERSEPAFLSKVVVARRR
jgi:ubiquinone/menaquinone biosynthesis C-methylase UbiE